MSEIAAGAGVNKQLISYYFGGKEGLYEALTGRWQSEESTFADPDTPLGRLVADYVRANTAHRDFGKLMIWQGLTDDGPPDPGMDEDVRRNVERLRGRQEAGELPADVDPAAVLVMLFAVASAGISFPRLVRAAVGLDPASPEFAAYFAEQVERLVGHLGDHPGPEGRRA